MVSKRLLYQIHARLNEINGTRDPSVTFGGLMMIFIGTLSSPSLSSPTALLKNALLL